MSALFVRNAHGAPDALGSTEVLESLPASAILEVEVPPDGRKRRRPTVLDRYRGCLLGGAVGDALGAPVEFMSLDHIRTQFGPQGIVAFAPAYGRLGAITDDTQMTLFTAEGFLRFWSWAGLMTTLRNQDIWCGHSALLRWLKTQGMESRHPCFAEATKSEDNGWLFGVQDLYSRRGPGNTCLSALMSGRIGMIEKPLNGSKGCGGVMRMAPAGLAVPDPAPAFCVGCGLAAITHGHPSGYLAAGTFAAILASIIDGHPLSAALQVAMNELAERPRHEECLSALEHAIAAAEERDPSPEWVESLGQGWVADEALAIAVYCALVAGDDFARGVRLAVNHGGDSDSTGAITGNLLGALLGKDAIPSRWLDPLELRQEIETIADDLRVQYRDDDEWTRRYPPR